MWRKIIDDYRLQFLNDLFEIKLIFYSLRSMLQFSQFVWALCSSVCDVFNNFLLIDATDWNKISSDQKRFFIALSLYPLSFFANTPFKKTIVAIEIISEMKTHSTTLGSWILNIFLQIMRRFCFIKSIWKYFYF